MTKNILNYLSLRDRDYRINIQNFAENGENGEGNDNLDNGNPNDDNLNNGNPEDDNISMSKSTFAKRLQRERDKAQKEAESKINDAITKAMNDFLEQQKEAEDLSKLSEKEREQREMQKRLQELETKEKQFAEREQQMKVFERENEILKAYQEEKLGSTTDFEPIAKILAKFDDDERNDAYLSIVDFLRNGIENGVKERFKTPEPSTSTKKDEENKKGGYGRRFANEQSNGGSTNSNFSRFEKFKEK